MPAERSQCTPAVRSRQLQAHEREVARQPVGGIPARQHPPRAGSRAARLTMQRIVHDLVGTIRPQVRFEGDDEVVAARFVVVHVLTRVGRGSALVGLMSPLT